MKYRAEDEDAGEWKEEQELGWADRLFAGSDCADGGAW